MVDATPVADRNRLEKRCRIDPSLFAQPPDAELEQSIEAARLTKKRNDVLDLHDKASGLYNSPGTVPSKYRAISSEREPTRRRRVFLRQQTIDEHFVQKKKRVAGINWIVEMEHLLGGDVGNFADDPAGDRARVTREP